MKRIIVILLLVLAFIATALFVTEVLLVKTEIHYGNEFSFPAELGAKDLGPLSFVNFNELHPRGISRKAIHYS